MIKGFATPEGTKKFRERFSAVPAAHFREKNGLFFSSIGIGTYLGAVDAATDKAYRESVEHAVQSGVNVIDTAINYRCQRSERSVGAALSRLIESGYSREEFIVATKGGFIPFDDAHPADEGGYVETQYVRSGIVAPEEIIEGCHVLAPRYLEDQLEKSRKNLGLETIDIYFLHNPETQLKSVARKDFVQKLRRTFEFLEKCVQAKKIRFYGAATWHGFRLKPEDREYLSLEETALLAREVAGPDHHFKAIQFPFNLAMSEAFTLSNQRVGAGFSTLLEASERYGFTSFGSASLLQGRLAQAMPQELASLFKGVKTGAQCALQFARSAPGLTTALTGMKSAKHVDENLGVVRVEPLPSADFFKLFVPQS